MPSLLSSTTSPLGFPNFREFLWACFLLSPLYISRCCLLLQLLLYNKTRDTSNSGDGLRNHILPLMLIRTLRPLSTPIPQSLNVSLGMNLSHRPLEVQLIEGDKHRVHTPPLGSSLWFLCMTAVTLTPRAKDKQRAVTSCDRTPIFT